MTKEDKQIIKRAVKEEWRIGDRSRLKRLLEKNLEQYREKVELENENEQLKKQIANLKETNAILSESAAINRKDLEYKVSVIEQRNKKIAELENKIADIKANCDLAIEGRDIKINELKLELTVEKDQHQEEINLHLHAEDYIESLEKENAELKTDKQYWEQKANRLTTEWGETLDQLAQAKKLLAKWVELFKPKDSNIPPTPIQVDTEQFLKEIEE